MQNDAGAQQEVEAAVAAEPEKTEPGQSLGGRLLDEVRGQLIVDVVSVFVKGAPEAAANCAEAVAGAAGSVAGAVVDGLDSL